MINLTPKTIFAVGATVAVLAYLTKRETVAAVKAVGGAVNPVSDQNIFYRGVNAVGGALTGQKERFRLGAWLYDKLNSEGSINHPEGGIDISPDRLKSNGKVTP